MGLDDGPHPGSYQPTEQSEVRDENQIPPFTKEEVIQGADVNQINSMLRGLSKDLRAFIIKFALNPDVPDSKTMEDAAQAILDLIAAAGGGGGGASPYDTKWWPKRTYTSARSRFDSTNASNAQMEGLPLWVPKTDTFDGILCYLGIEASFPAPGAVDFTAGDILRVAVYDNDDTVAGLWPKDIVVAAVDFDLTTLNPVGVAPVEILVPIPDTVLTGGKMHHLIMYHNVVGGANQVKTKRTDDVDYQQVGGIGFGSFFLRGFNAQQFPFAPLPATFPLLTPLSTFFAANMTSTPVYIALRKK